MANVGQLMTHEKAFRWLVDFGDGWVDVAILGVSWTMYDLTWVSNVEEGYLDSNENYEFRLSQKSIDLIKEMQDDT